MVTMQSPQSSPLGEASDELLETFLTKKNSTTSCSWYIYLYTLVVCMSGFAGGYTVGNIGPTILYIPKVIALSTFETTLVVSMVLIGALAGTLLSGAMSDRLGRRAVILISGLFGVASAILLTFAESTRELIIGRFLAGVAVGAASVASGLFLAETSPASIRGRLQGYGNLSGWVGGIVAHLVGFGAIYVAPAATSWRLIFAIGGLYYIPALLLTVTFLPESPRWLMSQRRDDEALRLLYRIHGPCGKDQVAEEYRCMQKGINLEGPNSSGIKELLRPEYSWPLFLSFALQVLQQFSGNNMISFYSSIILHDLGFGREASVLVAGLCIIPQALIIWLIVHALDKIGRRIPLLVSMVGSGLSLIVMASVVQNPAAGNGCSSSASLNMWLSLAGILLNRVFFSIGLGPLPTVVAAEILPFRIRGKGLAAAIGMGEVCKIISVTAFLPLTQAISPSYLYGGLAVGMFAGFASMVGCLYETKGSQLDTQQVPP